MASTPEGRLRDATGRWLAEIGQTAPVWAYKTHGGQYSRAGVPDYLVCVAGRFVAIELKSADGEPTALQRHELERIGGARGTAEVARTLDEVRAIVRFSLLGAGVPGEVVMEWMGEV